LTKILNAKEESLPSVESYIWCPLLEEDESPIKQPRSSLQDLHAFLFRTNLEQEEAILSKMDFKLPKP